MVLKLDALASPQVVAEALTLVDARFRAISSLQEIIVEVYEDGPSDNIRREMKNHGPYVLERNYVLVIITVSLSGYCRIWRPLVLFSNIRRFIAVTTPFLPGPCNILVGLLVLIRISGCSWPSSFSVLPISASLGLPPLPFYCH
jgi:hypothetical protein